MLSELLDNRWPAFIWGPPGAGKSSVVRQVAEERKLPVIDIRAPLLDPTDLRGIPAIVEGKATWCPPAFLPQPSDPPGLLFFDELNAAPQQVQASLYLLTLDRRVGEYVLPEGWRIVAAGNRTDDRAVVFRMPSPLANRFIHLDFEVDFGDWKRWALAARIHPTIVGFLSFRQELLLDMSDTDRGFPTPRSWEMASDTLRRIAARPEEIEDVLLGIVGEAAMLELTSFSREAADMAWIEAVLAAPDSAPLPEALDKAYALISYLTYEAESPKRLAAAGVIANRLSPDLGLIMVRDIISRNARFVNDPGYQRFVAQHGELLT